MTAAPGVRRLTLSPMAFAILAAAVAALTAGCGSLGVKAWERDVLARPEMQPDVQAMDRAIDDHIYFSKEGSSGGRSAGGGGCGCN